MQTIVDVQEKSVKKIRKTIESIKFEKEEPIDRTEESQMVIEYQKTKNEKILEKIYVRRIPTLKNWAIKHYFPGLAISIEDFTSELAIVFIKAVEFYKKGRGSFNTCLYTFLLNRIKNIKSGRYAKKRKTENYNGPLNGMILSLDYGYDDEDGNKVNLLEKLQNEDSNDYGDTINNIHFHESVDALTQGNPLLRDAFIKLGNGMTIGNLIKECKQKSGNINIEKYNFNKKTKKKMHGVLKDELKLDEFSLVKYNIKKNVLYYLIECKKTKESEMVMKAIKNLRKDKKLHLDFIKGNFED